MVANQIRPPGFPPIQNNQNCFNPNQGNNFNQNRGTNFNQNRGSNFNQGQVYQPPTIQTPVYQAHPQQMQGVSKTDFGNYVKSNDVVLRNMQNQGQGTLPSQTVINPREHVNAITTRSGQNPETSTDKVQKPSLESTAQVPPLEEEDSIFIEIPKPKAKKTVNVEIQDLNSPRPNSYQSKLPYPERMKVRENDKPSAQHSRFLKMFKQLRLEIGLKDALVALQEFDRTSALADSGASINLLPHSIYKQLGLGALTPTRMTLELANRSITHPMGIAEDVVVRVDGFTFLADFVVVNFEPDPRVPIILGRPFLRTAKALIDLYEEKLTLRVGSDELVFYAKKSEKSKNKQFAHAISVIDFSKDEPFSGSTTNHSDALPPSSSPVKTSDNLEEFADELTLLKKDVHFQVYSNPLFEFDDNFTSSNVNPLFNEMDEDVRRIDEDRCFSSPWTDDSNHKGVSYEVSVSAEGVEELKRIVRIKGEKKEALHTLRQKPEHAEFDESDTHVLERLNTSAGNPVKEILLKLNLLDHRILKDGGEGTDKAKIT
ncbi:reverse transcriptase domain-containing protein [Tanacetum coccineum]